MRTKINYLSLFLLLAGFIQTANAAEFTVSSDSDLANILPLSAGDVVTWTNGTYSNQNIVVTGNGTANNPVILKAETEGGVIFTGTSPANIYGSYVEVEGFYWEGGSGTSDHVSFRRSGSDTDLATNCTMRNCAFNDLAGDGDTKNRWIVLYGTQNVIENCSFINKRSTGAAILVELRFQGTAICQHQIRNNYFFNITPKDGRANSGDCESIRVGVSTNQSVDANCTIEGNYFQAADGENEIITNKSSNNIYKFNTFRDCRGSLVMRHGSGAWVEGNFFLGGNKESGGVRITDSFHTIINNYFQNLTGSKWNNAITIVGGETATGGSANGYQNVDDILVAFNTAYNCTNPLYYNDRGSNVPTGVLANNLFHSSGNVVGADDFDIGAGMDYVGNIGDGSNLVVNDAGLIAADITFVADGEIFRPVSTSAVADAAQGSYNTITTDVSGASRPSSNKDVGAHEVSGATSTGTLVPITDNEVGINVGCCFLNSSGGSVSGCSIVIGPSLVVSPNAVEFDSEASDFEVSVLANIDWTVSDDTDWISINTNSGSNNENVTISVTENTTNSVRSGTVTFTDGDGLTAVVVVEQNPFIATLSVSQESVSFSISSGSQTVSVSSNIAWSLTDDASWITVSPTSGNGNEDITITVTENTTGAQRSGVITINDINGAISTEIEIIQSATTFNPNDAESIEIVAVTAVGTQEDDPAVTIDNLTDDDKTTRWSGFANDGSVYFDLDLACPRILTSVQIYFHKGPERTSSFIISLSDNGVDFTDVTTVLTSEQALGFQEFTLAGNPIARYVRIAGYGNSANDWNSYEEVDVYGDNSPSACVVTSVDASLSQSSINIYPNPTTGSVNIEGINSGTYDVLDPSGSVIQSGTIESHNQGVNLEGLSSGIYFIRLTNSENTQLQKIIVE